MPPPGDDCHAHALGSHPPFTRTCAGWGVAGLDEVPGGTRTYRRDPAPLALSPCCPIRWFTPRLSRATSTSYIAPGIGRRCSEPQVMGAPVVAAARKNGPVLGPVWDAVPPP